MVHTMIHQKQFSIWYLAIRVCDYGIAGLFQLQRRRRVIFFLIASMIMSTGFTAAEEDNGLRSLMERHSTAGRRSAVKKVNGQSSMVL